MDLIIKKCLKCGATVEVMKDCNCKDCGIVCCGEPMRIMKANTVECAVEKHIPTYELIDNKIIVKVNHVMESDHYIEWIAIKSGNTLTKKILNPLEDAVATFNYEPNSIIYGYCNKHGLWSNLVK